MTTYKTDELDGALLDAAVAKAEGFPSFWIAPGDNGRNESCVLGPSRAEDARFDWCPSSTWEQGGPIIEREKISMEYCAALDWSAVHGEAFTGICPPYGAVLRGETALIAAMRAYVASKLGETVELP